MLHPAEVAGFGLAVVAVIVVARGLADRFRVPYAIVLTGCGLVYAALPLPAIRPEPEIVLWVVIPPLLYAAALRSSLIEIRADWRPITSLSVALVLVTAIAVGALIATVIPKITIAGGLVLGAAVAPPDPVAALSIGRRAGLPSRMLTLIGGEGMLNDATALTTLQVAVAATVSGAFSIGPAIGDFLLASSGGLVIGVAFGYLLRLARPLLRDPLRANAVSLATPFAAYLAGEAAHVSGVLAVVIAGLLASHDAPRGQSGVSRLQADAVWHFIEFMLEGVVFLLIGAQLPAVVRGLHTESAGLTAAAIAVTLAAVLLARPAWLFLTQSVPRYIGWHLGHHAPPLTGREVVALSWAGTRGVITLAAIFSVPLTVRSGRPFPDRDLLLLCAYLVVLVTLVGQGMTFEPLLRRLGLQANEAEDMQVRHKARLAAMAAAMRTVNDMQANHEIPADVAAGARTSLHRRADRHEKLYSMLADTDGEVGWTPEMEASVQVQHAMIDAQREELIRWRDSGRLSDSCLRTLQHELDHEESIIPRPLSADVCAQRGRRRSPAGVSPHLQTCALTRGRQRSPAGVSTALWPVDDAQPAAVWLAPGDLHPDAGRVCRRRRAQRDVAIPQRGQRLLLRHGQGHVPGELLQHAPDGVPAHGFLARRVGQHGVGRVELCHALGIPLIDPRYEQPGQVLRGTRNLAWRHRCSFGFGCLPAASTLLRTRPDVQGGWTAGGATRVAGRWRRSLRGLDDPRRALR